MPGEVRLKGLISRMKKVIAMNITYQYAVKFVCGESKGDVVAPGVYWTAINVHNPTYSKIGFRKKIAIALPGEKPGCVTDFSVCRLGPDEALEIDCKDIFRHVKEAQCKIKGRFLKGFVVIESDVELDVVAVYTAAGRDKQVETFHTERVSPRRREACLPDLVPVPRDNGMFCETKDGKLVVTVKNQGCGSAGHSITEVDFFSYGKVSLPTPPLAPGATVDLFFPIPPNCHDPDCEFRITVNASGSVTESDMSNNKAGGTCIG
ncbi:MAG TPA: hypothetical protein ENK38_02835 [Gammaproteobacteria bacterium]|nr:hypothetical protein [Gammaproteobacteria bacterium]